MIGAAERAFYFVRTSLRGIAASPGTAVVATATIAVALVLVGGFALLVLNMQELLSRFAEAVSVTAYLEEGLGDDARAQLVARASRIPGVASVRLVDEEEALARFRDGVGQGFALLEALGENPLPASLELSLADEARTSADLARVGAELATLPGVVDTSSGADWVEGYVRALALVRGLAIGLGVILALATTLIVSNTIRLAVLSRRDELEILALVGASRAFVNAPFLIEGALQGAVGGWLAWLVLYALFRLVLPGFEFGLELALGGAAPRFFDAGESLALWGAGAGLGLLGSTLALTAEARR